MTTCAGTDAGTIRGGNTGALLRTLVYAIAAQLLIIALISVLTYRTGTTVEVTNIHGDAVTIAGSGIYANETHLKAAILTSCDIVMALMVVPLLLRALGRCRSVDPRVRRQAQLHLGAVLGACLYYAVSVAFGVVYNELFLVYTALLGCSAFALMIHLRGIDYPAMAKHHTWRLGGRALTAFLIVGGVALAVAWLPDVVASWFDGGKLSVIGVYTTEITYVLDIGIIAPLMLATYRLLRRRDGLGLVLLAMLTFTCLLVGAQTLAVTITTIVSGIELGVVETITKVAIFVVLGAVAYYFDRKVYLGVTRRTADSVTAHPRSESAVTASDQRSESTSSGRAGQRGSTTGG